MAHNEYTVCENARIYHGLSDSKLDSCSGSSSAESLVFIEGRHNDSATDSSSESDEASEEAFGSVPYNDMYEPEPSDSEMPMATTRPGDSREINLHS